MISPVGDLRDFEGQPWSAWTDFLGIDVDKEDDVETSSSKLLLDYTGGGTFSMYPPSYEKLNLVQCLYCGNKIKLSSIANHIELNHLNGKKVEPSPSESCSIELKKGGTKPKVKQGNSSKKVSPLPLTPPYQSNFSKKAKQTPPPPLIKEQPLPVFKSLVEGGRCPSPTSSFIKKIKQESSKAKKLKESNGSPKSKAFSKAVVNGSNVELQNEEKKTDPNKKRSSIEKKNNNSVLKDFEDSTKKHKVKEGSNLSTPLLFNNSDIRNTKEVFSLKGKTYDADRHCGVVEKENGKPCTNPLTCKIHSVSLRRTVQGRTKPFDTLLADHRTEKKHKERATTIEEKKSLAEDYQENGVQNNKLPLTVNSNNNKCEERERISYFNGRDSHHPPLSLPVSIKNPSLIADFKSQHNSVQSPTKKVKFNLDTLLNCSNKLSSQSKEILWRKRKTRKKRLRRKKQLGGLYSQWHPWYRRVGGMLYTHNNLPSFLSNSKTTKKEKRKSLLCPTNVNLANATTSQTFMLDDLKNIYFQLVPDNKFSSSMKIPNKKMNIAFPPKGGSFVINSPRSTPQFLIKKKSNQVNTFSESDCSDSDVSNSSFMEDTCDPRFNLLEPIKPLKEVIRLRLNGSNCHNESHSLPEDKSLNLGVGSLNSGEICLETKQRIHFVTPSGPAAVSLKQCPEPFIHELDTFEIIQPNLNGLQFPLDPDEMMSEATQNWKHAFFL